ncbi:hypothetical protein CTAM01_11195 [Colletotrichum tamarilloi]|uniref:Uncharacterized protein n=1 Tax=Colletotrichum tamarilloi TaxID=1209934 RepID=A0ABQ9QYG9_9PEZI|nr:uncharacterized protein CTAM01_11195 [Colletotrichum tamarilloi]KAK1489240.1 hypothetical protein CTAM01_11195 [Colletotrichum tamarilloi]
MAGVLPAGVQLAASRRVSCKLAKCFQLEEGTKRGPCMYWVHACLPVQMIPTYLRYRTYA